MYETQAPSRSPPLVHPRHHFQPEITASPTGSSRRGSAMAAAAAAAATPPVSTAAPPAPSSPCKMKSVWLGWMTDARVVDMEEEAARWKALAVCGEAGAGAGPKLEIVPLTTTTCTDGSESGKRTSTVSIQHGGHDCMYGISTSLRRRIHSRRIESERERKHRQAN